MYKKHTNKSGTKLGKEPYVARKPRVRHPCSRAPNGNGSFPYCQLRHKLKDHPAVRDEAVTMQKVYTQMSTTGVAPGLF